MFSTCWGLRQQLPLRCWYSLSSILGVTFWNSNLQTNKSQYICFTVINYSNKQYQKCMYNVTLWRTGIFTSSTLLRSYHLIDWSLAFCCAYVVCILQNVITVIRHAVIFLWKTCVSVECLCYVYLWYITAKFGPDKKFCNF